AAASVPSALTVSVGAPAAASVSVFPVLPPSSTIQLPVEPGSVSPKTRLPTVCGASSITMVSSTSSIVLNAAVLPVPPPTMPSCRSALSVQSPPLTARSHVPLPISRRVKICPVVKPPFTALPAASVMPVPAAFTSSRTVPSPESGPTVTSTVAPDDAETPEMAPVSPPPNVAVKSAASTPFTGSVNVTRNTIALALPDAAAGAGRVMDQIAGADVSTMTENAADAGLDPTDDPAGARKA